MTQQPPPSAPLDYRNPADHTPPDRPSSTARNLILLGVALILVLVVISMLLPSLGRARESSNRVKCASNLKQLGSALWIYANEHPGQPAPDIFTLLATTDISSEVFVCASSNHDKATGTTPAEINASLVDGNHLSYVWTATGLHTDKLDPAVVLAFDLDPHVPVDSSTRTTGTNVLLADGSVTFVDEKVANALRAQLAAGLRPIRLPTPPSPATTPTTSPTP